MPQLDADVNRLAKSCFCEDFLSKNRKCIVKNIAEHFDIHLCAKMLYMTGKKSCNAEFAKEITIQTKICFVKILLVRDAETNVSVLWTDAE